MPLEVKVSSPDLTLESSCLNTEHVIPLCWFPSESNHGSNDFVKLYAKFVPNGTTLYFCFGQVSGVTLSRESVATENLQEAIDEYNSFFERWRPTGN